MGKDQFSIGVFSVVHDAQKRILLIHRRDYDLWDLPGGGMKYDETPMEAVIRETMEETGFEIQTERLLLVYNKPAPYNNDIVFVFKGHAVGGKTRINDEADDVSFFSLSELPDNISPVKRRVIEIAKQNPKQTLFELIDVPHPKNWLQQAQKRKNQ